MEIADSLVVTGSVTANGVIDTGGTTSPPVVVAAAGGNLATATAIPITARTVNVTTTNSTEGVKLPAAVTGKVVTLLTPTNKGYKVYAAATGQVINAATTATTAYAMATNRPATFFAVDAVHWRALRGS